MVYLHRVRKPWKGGATAEIDMHNNYNMLIWCRIGEITAYTSLNKRKDWRSGRQEWRTRRSVEVMQQGRDEREREPKDLIYACYHVPCYHVYAGDYVSRKNNLTEKIEGEIDLLKRHVEMLIAIKKSEPIGIIRLSEMMNCPQHKVRYSLRILEQEGLIEPTPDGARIAENVEPFLNDLNKTLDIMEESANDIRDACQRLREIER